jgi:hypothetical protein
VLDGAEHCRRIRGEFIDRGDGLRRREAGEQGRSKDKDVA